MSELVGYEPNLQRGQMLRQAGHFEQACRYLGGAIQADPEQPQAYLELALAQSELPGLKQKSLAAIDRAVSLAPNSAHFLGFKAYLLSHFGRQKEALEVSARALSLEPFSHIGLLALCNVYTRTKRWIDAETIARRMLEVDPDDICGLNLLAQALRCHNRLPESRTVIAQIFARVPNDAFGHSNAGYEALNSRDHRRAKLHFLESLRLEPMRDLARRGLLQAMRAESLIYRTMFRIIDTVGASGDNFGRIAVLLCVFSGGLLLGPLLLYFAMAFSLQPLSNLCLLREPMVRQILSRKEKGWAIFTGVITGLVLLMLLVTPLFPIAILLGIYLAFFAFSFGDPSARATRRPANINPLPPVPGSMPPAYCSQPR